MARYEGSSDWGGPRGLGARGGAGIGTWAKTGIVMAGLIALLVVFGRAAGGYQGMLLFGGLGVLINFAAWWWSDKFALMAHRARPLQPGELPWLQDTVDELARKAGIPTPRLYVIPSRSPNAFATGRSPSKAALAVTEGILEIMDRRMLRGVLAHEIGHVINRDTLISTIAATVAGLISSLASVVKWGALLGGMGGRDRENEGAAGGLALLVMAIIAPIVAMLLQLLVSRTREFGADETGARLCGDPNALADALERLEAGVHARPYEYAGPATAHLFIVNPLRGGGLMKLFSTHPPIEERVARLRRMLV